MCTPAQVNEIEPSISTVHMAKHERSNTFLLFRRFLCVSPTSLTVKWSQIQNLLFGVDKYIWPNRLIPDAIQLPFVALYIIHCWFNRFPPLIFKRTLILRVEEWRRQIFDTSSGRLLWVWCACHSFGMLMFFYPNMVRTHASKTELTVFNLHLTPSQNTFHTAVNNY